MHDMTVVHTLTAAGHLSRSLPPGLCHPPSPPSFSLYPNSRCTNTITVSIVVPFRTCLIFMETEKYCGRNCQARVQVQGLSQISNKRPGPGACSYNCNVSTTTHPLNFSEQNNIEISSCMNRLVILDSSGGDRRS